ncbi:MAG: DUF4837 family protein [Tannerella sp.]|jgi:hypothetical protein|nr:DUF4837 family protein [Tannerella sp.]
MKTATFTSIIGLLLLMLGACNSSSLGTNATGMTYEIVVVTDKPAWDSTVGEVLKKELYMDVPGLPQSEPSMRIIHVKPADFNGMMTYVRNILLLNVDNTQFTKVSLKSEKNRWAGGQVVVTITTPDEATLAEYMTEHPGVLVDYFTKMEMERTAATFNDAYSRVVSNKLKEKFDITLKVSTDIVSWKDTTDFFWASNDANSGRSDIVVYTFPYTDSETFTKEYLIAKRDSILGANIPGSFPNSYMSTNEASVTFTPKAVNGKYCGVLRGLWETKGDMMGGPFVSFARVDETRNLVVVTEGFVFAPESDKRKYIRRLEASLYTLRLPGETDEQLAAEQDNKIKIPTDLENLYRDIKE